jgi:hypothetical protein
MDILWIILKIAIYTYILNVIFSQLYNFVFMFWRKPVAWIFLVSVLSILHMAIAYSLAWNPRSVSCAVLLTFLLKIPPPSPKILEKAAFRDMIDNVYLEMGIVRGRLKYRLGVAAFAVFSLASYLLFFGEACDAAGRCEPLFRAL